MLSRQEAQARDGGLYWTTDVRKKPPDTQQGHARYSAGPHWRVAAEGQGRGSTH